MLIALAALCSPDSHASDGPIRIEGSSTLVPFVREAVRGFTTEENFKLQIPRAGAGTKPGIACAKSGECAIGLASRALTEQELEGLKIIPIGWDATVLVTHPGVTVANLTSAQVRSLFDGTIRNWKELGGPDLAVVPYQRDAKRGSREIVDEYFHLKSKAPEFGSDTEELHRLPETPGCVSYFGYGLARSAPASSLRIPKLDGIEPTADSIRSGKWPLRKELLMLVRKDAEKDPRIAKVIDRVLERRKQAFDKFGFVEK